MKIQIDIPEELNKKLKIHKEVFNFPNLQESVLDIVEFYFQQHGKQITELLEMKIKKGGKIKC